MSVYPFWQVLVPTCWALRSEWFFQHGVSHINVLGLLQWFTQIHSDCCWDLKWGLKDQVTKAWSPVQQYSK